MWDGKGDYIMWRQSLIHTLRKAGYGYVLSIEGIYQFDDPEDKASDIYKTSAIKREDRITSILGKHFKENPDTARQSLSNAYYGCAPQSSPTLFMLSRSQARSAGTWVAWSPTLMPSISTTTPLLHSTSLISFWLSMKVMT